MRNFETIYEYSFNGSDIWHIIPIFLFAAFGFGIIYCVKKYYKRFSLQRQFILFFGWIMGLIASVIFIVFIIKIPSIHRAEKDLKDMIKNETYLIVEGEVENFMAPRKSPNHFESFSVNGIDFRYSEYVIIDGFNKTSNNGGPIKINGQMVRIGYIKTGNENVILKLEMIKND
jgi:energy-coupling factor transporter transmembrane protein EcfT